MQRTRYHTCARRDVYRIYRELRGAYSDLPHERIRQPDHSAQCIEVLLCTGAAACLRNHEQRDEYGDHQYDCNAEQHFLSDSSRMYCHAERPVLYSGIPLPHLHRTQSDLLGNEHEQEPSSVQAKCELRADADSERRCNRENTDCPLQSKRDCANRYDSEPFNVLFI